ncbi:MAG: tetratricopeptide repeat protein [Burkholderiaceae bacterium]|jgi:predicted Zn-dependent protease|nr:tetratricopeptide repeat protein [Burkholderiaceae bacterium]
MVAVVAHTAGHAAEAQPLQGGRDYYAWQIATGEANALQKQFHQYRELPYVRIERRGKHHVLRAGFWPSSAEARAALSRVAGAQPLIRVATYRPDAVLHQNWEAAPQSQGVQFAPPVAPPRAVEAPVAPSVSPSVTRPPSSPGPAPDVPRVASAPATDAALRVFNQDDFALAFQVFLGSGDQQRAYQVASQAVASVPANTDWRRKLARLADWTNRPLVAWEHWHYLFQHGDRSAETSSAVLRLAPLAGQPEVAIAVWKTRAARAPLSPEQWEDLLALFEAADQVSAGSVYFENHYRQHGNPTLLEYAAQLANNLGDDARAIALYRERASTPPFSLDATSRAVLLLIRADRLREAFDLMQAHRHDVPADRHEFWRILGNTAWDLQETAAAEAAYRTYAQSPQATAADWSRLVYLARQRSPQLGAELALEAYRRLGRLDDLLLALEIYAQSADYSSQTRVFKALTADVLQRVQKQPRFLLLRAQFYQHQGDQNAAWSDLQSALVLAPSDSQVALSSLWFLIDRGRKQELALLLPQLAPQGRDDADYWLAFAAAHQLLDQHREAVVWYQKVVRRQPDDGLLLLNYADALQAVRRVGMADRVRRHAWLRLREKSAQLATGAPLDKQPELLAWARLRLQNQPGDASLKLVRETVAHLRGLDATSLRERAQVQNLVLGWAVSTEQFLNARNWMWLQQARRANGDTSAPIWADSQVALQLGDTQRMRTLLDQRASSMPIYNRYDTAYALENREQALNIAFGGMQRNGDDQDLHDRYRQHAPGAANYVQYRASNEAAGDLLGSQSCQLEAGLQIGPHLQMVLGWSHVGQSTSDATLATLLPTGERLNSVGLQWQQGKGNTEARLFERNEFTAQWGATLDQTWNWSQRLVLAGGLGYRADALESLALRTGGNQDYLQFALNYLPDKRDYVRWQSRWAQYSTQHGDALGTGQVNDLEWGYRLRLDYPDVRLRLYVSDQAYVPGSNGTTLLAKLPTALGTSLTAAGIDPVRYFIPESSTTWGACAGFGENLSGQNIQQIYTRAIRPFMELCALDNSRTGTGYSGAFGVAGSVLGADHLSLKLEQNEGGIGSVGGAVTRAWTLRYRSYF